MTVEFLTDAEAASYGRYNGPPPRAELERAFFLDDADKVLVARRRGHHNRLGFALQLTTVRSLGLFLADPLDVPNAVLEYLAEQLAVSDLSCVKRYTERRSTRFEHAVEFGGVLGLRDFAEAEPELTAWVDARVWTAGDGPKAIFTDAVAWLLDRRVLLPGVRTLARLVAQVRDAATQRLWDMLYELLTASQSAVLERLLEVPDGARFSDLERWRKGPAQPHSLRSHGHGRRLPDPPHRVGLRGGSAQDPERTSVPLVVGAVEARRSPSLSGSVQRSASETVARARSETLIVARVLNASQGYGQDKPETRSRFSMGARKLDPRR